MANAWVSAGGMIFAEPDFGFILQSEGNAEQVISANR